jgi:predicted amidohydrolase
MYWKSRFILNRLFFLYPRRMHVIFQHTISSTEDIVKQTGKVRTGMKVGIYQFAPEFGEKEKNFLRIEETLGKSDADLVVLPELCTTGYQFVSREEIDALCEPVPDGPSVERFIRICTKKNMFLVAGIAEKSEWMVYNTAVLVGPGGFIGSYRKVHLFYEERQWFQKGNLSFPVFDIGKVKIGLMICFDWIFPEAARSLALQGADILCHPVNLVLPYCQEAMVTRSIENGVFTITANRVGSEARGGKEKLAFTGGSQVVGPRGQLLFRLGTKNEAFREIEIDPIMARDKQITQFNHILNDRIPDQYRL